eukprot:468939-Lingulodinium_polyedra.AAC.1
MDSEGLVVQAWFEGPGHWGRAEQLHLRTQGPSRARRAASRQNLQSCDAVSPLLFGPGNWSLFCCRALAP